MASILGVWPCTAANAAALTASGKESLAHFQKEAAHVEAWNAQWLARPPRSQTYDLGDDDFNGPQYFHWRTRRGELLVLPPMEFTDGRGVLRFLSYYPSTHFVLQSLTMSGHLAAVAPRDILGRCEEAVIVTPLNGEVLRLITRTAQNLRVLSLRSASLYDIRALTHCRRLQRLDVSQSPVDSEGIEGVQSLPELLELNLSSTKVTSVSALKVCPRLVALYCGSSELTSTGLDGVEGISTLIILDVRKTAVKSVEAFASHRALQAIILMGTAVGDQGIAGIGNVSSLKLLDVKSTPVKSVKALCSLKRLTLLVDERVEIDAEPLATIVQKRFKTPSVKKLWDNYVVRKGLGPLFGPSKSR